MPVHPEQATPVKRRILIVDANPLLRRGLAALIDNEPDLAVCAEAAADQKALDAIATERPDLVIADFSVMNGLGLELVREICARPSAVPVLLMALDASHTNAERAFKAGAVGLVSKLMLDETVLTAIRGELDGGK